MSAKNAEVKAAPRVGRRALLATGAVGICGAAVITAPKTVPFIEQHIQQAEQAALLNGLGELEGTSLDAAIRAAEITRAAVQVVVLPLARLIAAVGSGGLNVLIASLNIAVNALGVLHLNNTVLTRLRDLFVTWNGSVNQLPIALSAYTTADITSAEKYLKALKQKTQHPQA